MVRKLPYSIQILEKFISPLILAIFNYYALPWVIFKIVQLSRYERKSEKDESFMNKNIFFMIMNGLIIPLIVCAYFSTIHE